MGSRRPLSKLMCPAEPIKPKWTRYLYHVLHKCTVFLPRFLYEAIHAILYVHFSAHFIVFAKLARYHHKLYFWYIQNYMNRPQKKSLRKKILQRHLKTSTHFQKTFWRKFIERKSQGKMEKKEKKSLKSSFQGLAICRQER